MSRTWFSAALALLSIAALAFAQPAPSTASLRALMAPTGTLRAVFLGGNPVQGRVDSRSGQVSGPVADLVERLATTLGVSSTIIPAADARAVMQHLQAGTADIGFLAFDASRAQEVDFAGAFAVMHNSYVVADSSPIRQSADVDRAGAMVGAVKGQTQEIHLSSHLRNARVRVFDQQPSREVLEALLASGELVAFGVNRQRALDLDAESPRLRALPDSFLDVPQSFVVAKGEAAKRAFLIRFVAELNGTGFMEASLRKAGLEQAAAAVREEPR